MDPITDTLVSGGLSALAAVIDVVLIVLGGLAIYAAKILLSKWGIDANSALMLQIEETIDTAVLTTNQMVVQKMKKDSDNGSLTPEQSEEVFNITKEKILQTLTSKEVDAIVNKYLNIDDGLEQLIEKHVYINH